MRYRKQRMLRYNRYNATEVYFQGERQADRPDQAEQRKRRACADEGIDLGAVFAQLSGGACVEVAIGDRYKPDVIALDATGIPQFWGEAGQVGEAKWRALLRRYPHTHFAWGKWATRLTPHVALVEHVLAGLAQRAAVDILEFPRNSATRFVDDSGQITVDFADLNWVRLTQRDAGANRRVPS